MKQIFFKELKCSFELRNPKGEKPSLVYLYSRVCGVQCKLSLGVKVYPYQWDACLQRAMVNSHLSPLCQQNNRLVNLSITRSLKAFSRFKAHVCANPCFLPNAVKLLRQFIHEVQVNEIGVGGGRPALEVFEGLIDGGHRSQATKTIYHSRLAVFADFLKSRGLSSLSLNALDKTVVRAFSAYLFRVRSSSVNTHNQYIKFLFSRLSDAEEDGAITREQRYRNGVDRIFRLPKVQDKSGNRPALTEEQLEMLVRCPLHGKEAEVRDLFVLDCNLGQRFGDFMSKVNRDTVYVDENGTDVVELIQDKRNHRVVVPITRQAKDILERYHYRLPVYTASRANYYLPKICEKAGLCTNVQVLTETSSGGYVTRFVPLYSLVTTHTARRTFATRCYYKWGIDIMTISKLLGHSSIHQTEEYVKITSSQVATLAARLMK